MHVLEIVFSHFEDGGLPLILMECIVCIAYSNPGSQLIHAIF